MGAKEKGRGHMGDGREVAGGLGAPARLRWEAERDLGITGAGAWMAQERMWGIGQGGNGEGGEQEMVGAGCTGAFEEAQRGLGLARRRS